jgi:hypothetical protein
MEEVEDYPEIAPAPVRQAEDFVTVSIDSYKIEEGRMKKHVVYIIAGQDSAGVFEASRRYKEFLHLRSWLIMAWPGCSIPKLPKKKATGNLTTTLIHKRKKLLDYFVGKIVGQSFLYKTEAFQIFIRGPPDFVKGSQSLKALTYSDLIEVYQKTFPETERFEMAQRVDDEVAEFHSVLEQCLAKLKDFKRVAKASAIAYYRYEDSVARLCGDFNQVAKFYYPAKEASIGWEKKTANPYRVLLDWLRKEILELESVVEAIEKKVYLENVLGKSQAKLGKQQQGLENFQSGKKSLLQRLSKKSDEQKLKDLESQVAESEKEMTALQHVIRIATARIVMEVVPGFKQKEPEKLEVIMRSYSGVVTEAYNDYLACFEKVQALVE